MLAEALALRRDCGAFPIVSIKWVNVYSTQVWSAAGVEIVLSNERTALTVARYLILQTHNALKPK